MLFRSIVGWIWVAASLAAVYFLVRAVFFGDGWWPVVTSVVAASFLYKVSLYYVLEKSGQLPKATAEVRSPSLLPKPKPPVSGAEVPAKGGTTPESAICIHAANSLEGIPKEYAALTSMFGSRNRDWKVIERIVIHAENGRKLEKFIVSASGQRKEVYFDVSEFLNSNDQKTKAALDNLIARHDKALTVLLPKEELMTLQMGVLRLTEENLQQLGILANERKQMLDPLVDAILRWKEKDYASIPEHINVTMMISVWTRIMALLASWQPGSLLQEEEIENLKAIIGGTMKSARDIQR